MLQRLLFLLAVSLIWLSNPPSFMDRIVAALGLTPQEGAGALVTGALVAAGLLLLEAVIAILADILRPLDPSYKGGVWAYALLPQENTEFQDERPTVGMFSIRRRKGDFRVTNGKSYQIEEQKLKLRGDWNAGCVVAKEDSLDLIYDLKTYFLYKKEVDREYKGHIRLNDCDCRGVWGRAYKGDFNDLNTRSHVKGPIYAEHISRLVLWRSTWEKRLQTDFQRFFDQLHK